MLQVAPLDHSLQGYSTVIKQHISAILGSHFHWLPDSDAERRQRSPPVLCTSAFPSVHAQMAHPAPLHPHPRANLNSDHKHLLRPGQTEGLLAALPALGVGLSSLHLSAV